MATTTSEQADPIGQRLVWSEIVQRYPNEWVLLAEVQGERGDPNLSGILLGHDPLTPNHDPRVYGYRVWSLLWTGRVAGRGWLWVHRSLSI